MFAQRRPVFHRLLDCEDELFAVITAALDRQSLVSGSSSFAESLYGLRRNATREKSSPKSLLDKKAQYRTLFFLVSASCWDVCSVLWAQPLIDHLLYRLHCHMYDLRWRHSTTGIDRIHSYLLDCKYCTGRQNLSATLLR